MPIVVYMCKHCKRTFDNRQAAVDCEKSHLKIKATKVLEYCYNEPFPLYVDIEFNNGSKELYILEKEAWRR